MGFIVFILTLGVLTSLQPANAQWADDWGYTPIFNGRDFTGWEMQWPGIWEVEKGVMVGKQDPETGADSWMFTKQEWDDFALILEFKMTDNCNSGVGIRMPAGQEGRPSQYGYEIQISDVDEQYPTGSVFRHHSASKNLHGKNWNRMDIICVNDHIVVYVNRQKVTDVRLENSFKGRIGLQVHGGENLKDQVVQFRNIRVKDLKPQVQNAQPSPIQFTVTQLHDGLSEGLAVVDINRDGKLDITCGEYWYEAPSWTPHKYRECVISGEFNEFFNNYGEIAMDVNQDGWMDIISGGWFIPKMAWYENPGTVDGDPLWKEHIISNEMHGTETVLACDVDHDGRMDLLANLYNMAVPVHYFAYVGLDNSESGFEKRVLGHYGRGHGGGYGDLNSDGRNDILTPEGWYECPMDPVNEDWPFHKYPKAGHSSIPFLVDDLNQDGMPDFIWGHAHDFGLYWMEQTRDSAGRMAWIQHTIDDTYSQIHCPVLIDMDGDGTKDIVAGKRYRGHAGSDPGANEPVCLFWYKVEKGPEPTFTKYIITYDENIGTGMNFQVIDIDFDGDLDIVTAGKTGLYLLTNTTR
jgi:hypothetical protein